MVFIGHLVGLKENYNTDNLHHNYDIIIKGLGGCTSPLAGGGPNHYFFRYPSITNGILCHKYGAMT